MSGCVWRKAKRVATLVFACALVIPPAWGFVTSRVVPGFLLKWAVCAGTATVVALFPPQWWPVADGSAVSLAAAALAWWWTQRGGRERCARILGARALARLARLAAGMRDAARGPEPGARRA